MSANRVPGVGHRNWVSRGPKEALGQCHPHALRMREMARNRETSVEGEIRDGLKSEGKMKFRVRRERR